MTNRLKSGQVNPGESRLVRALEQETEALEPAGDGLGLIRARIAQDTKTADRRRHQRRGMMAGAVALGVAAAAAVIVLGPGTDRSDTTPEPARTPSVAVPGDFDPSTPRTSWTVYRVGDDPGRAGNQPKLFAEEVRATPPYEPRQALAELLAQPAADPALRDDGSSPATQVGAVARTGSEIVVDLTAVDPFRWVVGTDGPETTHAWVQAWVATVQEAYQSDRPVLFTLNGQPLPTLFGVDTSKPIQRDEQSSGFSHEIFLPRDGEEVSSPVALSASPVGKVDWTVVSRSSGETVFETTTEDEAESGAGTLTVDDLSPGGYRLTIRRDLADEPPGTPGWVRSVDFRVGNGPAPTVNPPVSNPATGTVPVTQVFFPAADGRSLISEPLPRTSAAAAVEALVAGSAADPRLDRTGLSGEGVTVSESDDEVRVDFANIAGRAAPTKAPELDGQALVHTLDAFYGRSRPVVVTVRGQPARLPGSPARLTWRAVTSFSAPGLSTPRTDTTVDNPLTIVGRAAPGNTALTWYLVDPVSNETRYQGTAAVAEDLVYAFSLPVLPGDYLLQTTQKVGDYQTTVNYAVTVREG